MTHTLKRITTMIPANGWFALYHDDERKIAFVMPLVSWVTFTPEEDDRDYGVVGLVAMDNDIDTARTVTGFIGYFDETQAWLRLSHLNNKGANVDEDAIARFRNVHKFVTNETEEAV